MLPRRAGARADDLGGPKRFSGGARFEIKHKSHCFQKSKLVDWGGQACRLGGGPRPSPGASPAPTEKF